MNKLPELAVLSQSQLAIYAECMQHPEEATYDQPFLLKLGKGVDLQRLQAAIKKALEAHPYMQCRVVMGDDGEPKQYIDTEAPVEVPIIKVDDIEAAKKTMWKPFHFDGSSLTRLELYDAPDTGYLLMQVHHIIYDSMTYSILFADIENAYQGRELSKEDCSAIDYARQEAADRKTERWQEDKQWYVDHILDTEVETALLPDLEGQDTHFSRLYLPMKADVAAVTAFCKQHGFKVSNYMCSAFALLMSRYGDDEQVLFSTIWHGRVREDIAHTCGMFATPVPLYYQLKADATVGDLLEQGRMMSDGTREHNMFSLSDAVNELGLRLNLSFGYQGTTLKDIIVGGEKATYECLFSHATYSPATFQLFLTNDGYELCAEYMSNLYSEAFIRLFAESLDTVIMQLTDLERPLRDITTVSPEQVKLLDSFNETADPYDDTQTVVSLFRQQASLYPDKTAVVYKDRQYTYREVDKITDRLAAYLAGKGLGREDVVAILIPRCEWMALASLGVLKAGCGYQPLDPTYPEERLNFMTKDAGVKMLIADEELRPLVSEYAGDVLLTRDIASLPSAEGVELQGPTTDSLFNMLYTSGSTGVPKGCQLEHRNVVAFCHMNARAQHITAESRIGAYASYGFDASVMEVFCPLTHGATVYVIPEELRLDLVALNDYIEQNHITHIFMTTQVAYQFATNFENQSLQRLMTGGEKLPSLVPPKSFIVCNGYGPSETICYVTQFEVTEQRKNVPIGVAQRNLKCYVVDKSGHRLPPGASGELWVAGPQVTRGYLNRPEKTAEVFVENPFEGNAAANATFGSSYHRAYRTGDVVRYLPDGNIEFVGRKDGQVKIRGFRIELKEVEAVIRQYTGIKDVTVQAFDDPGGGKFIAAYIVSDEQVDISQLNNFIMEEKPPYMVPAVTMQIDRIPLNQNQKVDKKALPKPKKENAAESDGGPSAPLNVLEQELKSMVVAIVSHEDFGLTTPLGYAGLTSIMAIKLAIQVNKRFGVELNSKTLAKTGTLQSIENEILSKMLSGGGKEAAADTAKTPEKEKADGPVSAPLSYAQMGVYVDCLKQPASTLYNLPALLTFAKDTDADRLAQSLTTLVKLHPEFTIHFGSEGTDVVQISDPQQEVVIARNTMSAEQLETYKREFVQPFNLKQGPLYRFEIITTEDHVCLLVDIHHLVIDGGSMNLFLHQLCDLMDGREVEAEDLSYADFVAEEKKAEGSSQHQAARDFFHSQLGECEGVTEVASDLTNPLQQGNTREVVAPLDFEKVQAFCREHNVTAAHLTLAATFYALSRFTNQERICICTISNGRSNLRISNTVGMFVNTLAMSSEIREQRVLDFIKLTSRNFDETLEHENYPFAQIAADYDLSAEIMFAYQVGVLEDYVCGGTKVEMESLELDIPKFRIAFYIRDHEGQPSVCVEYDNGRYSAELMRSLAQSVSNAVNAFIAKPDADLLKVSLLNAEQTQLLDSFNQTDVPYDNTQTITSLFRRQVALTPDNECVVYHEHRYTYREVDQISERIAAYIAAQQLGTEDVVSVLIPRCEWMVIASLGVLKAGCAYQPLDPSYPSERLNFMMKDANAKLLIADEELRHLVDEYDGAVLLTKEIDGLPEPTKPVEADITPDNLFIMLYTSGSTGVPKGCQLEHRNIVAFCHWYQRCFELNDACHVAAYASYGFDACMMDIYPAVTCGACVYIIGEDIRLNLPDLNIYFEENQITHSFITTQVGYQFATNTDNHSLRFFAVGGEKLSSLNPPTNYKMYNGYGPTECTIFTTHYWVKDQEQDIPIGKPLDNLRLYIVDKLSNRLPQGACGELWVSGPQVSRGYLNRPEKTAEVYIQNPFDADAEHQRCYRTGDIVRYLPDGNIQFVGRRDGQVKIRGFRIELKEVEAVIRQFPGIKDATVQAFDYENGGKFIAAYIVSDEQVDVKQLNDFIGRQKPSYMIPAATMQIPSIPLNQNQKVNRKALPAPVIQTDYSDYVAPANDLERLFCDIFAGILTMEKVGATSNFFELGGTSLMVTRVIIEADKHHHHVAYGDIFSHPTPRKLAEFLTGAPRDAEKPADNSEADYDYKPIDVLLMRNTLENFKKGERQTIGNVLLTGATGYLGIHVLKELIDRADVPNIWCLVRAGNEEKAERRLKQLLFYYFGQNFNELFGTRLHIVLGDVTQNFSEFLGGITNGQTSAEQKIDTVFNCAAIVKHYSKGTEIEDVNIGGAVNCVKFCVMTGARLVHISTYSTGGLAVNGVPADDVHLTEHKLYFGQCLDNQYVHSKFISERVVLEAIALHGLNAKIVRVGNLAPRSTDGEFQINFQTNSAMGRIRVFKMLGCYPYEMSDVPMEFSPINEVAQSIILLSETPRECCVFHSYNNHSVFFGDVLAELRHIGGAPKQVENDEFVKAMQLAKDDPEKAKRLSSLLAYQDMAHGQITREIEPENDYTTQVLYRLGFHWSTTSWDYVDQFLVAIDGMGYFDDLTS